MSAIHPPKYSVKLADKIRSRPLRWLLRKPLVGFLLHWTFQGVLFMKGEERNIRIISELTVATLFFLIFRVFFNDGISLAAALLLAHTLNFILNAQIWAVMRQYGYVHHSREEFEQYIAAVAKRVDQEPSIIYAAVYGSTVRDQWKSSSDLDIRAVRKRGWKNGIRAHLFALRERTRGFVSRFPIDISVLNNLADATAKLDDENPIILKG